MEAYISTWLDENTDLNLSLLLEHCDDDAITFSCGDDTTSNTITININDNYNITCNSDDNLLNSITSQINEWRIQHTSTSSNSSSNSSSNTITLDMILDQITIASNNMIIDDDDNDDDQFKDDSITYSDDDDNNDKNDSKMDTSIDIIILKRKLTEKHRLLRGMNDDNDDKIKKQKSSSSQKIDYFSPDASSLALMNDFIHYYKNGKEEGLVVTAIDDDMFNWNVKITRFNYDTQIAEDLVVLEENFGYSYVEINLQFQPNVYPFYPPLVTIVRPRFEGFMLGQIATMTCLQLSHWDPLSGIKITFSEIKNQIERYGKIVQESVLNNREAYPQGAYSLLEHTLLKLTFVCEKTPRVIRIVANDKKSKKSPLAIDKKENVENVKASPKADSESTANAVNTKTDTEETVNESTANDSKKQGTPWAKGTGYGFGHQKNNWDTRQYILAQKEQVRLKQSLLGDVYAIMKDHFDKTTETHQNEGYNIHRIIDESCLVSLLVDIVDIDSLLEIEEKQTDLFKVVFQIIELLASVSGLKYFLEKLPFEESSLRSSIESLDKKIAIYTRTSHKSTALVKSTDENIIDYISKVIALVKSVESLTYDMELSSSEAQAEAITKSSLPVFSSSSVSSLSREDLEDLYKRSLRHQQYGELDDIPGYHYKAKLGTMSMNDIKNIRRLAGEHSDWPGSLPLFLNSSIWIRASSDRMDVVRFIISGPEGTPYSSGLFLFDAYFTSNYPNEPPKINLMTTGGGTVRFNPNLYNCGKVCLSLLGTWPGDNGWDRNMSTFLQILISIQSLILVEEPYFNEPGYEKSMGTTSGDLESKRYNRNIRSQNINFAMIDMIKNPPKGFEDIVTLHFRLKKDIIANETGLWLADDPTLSSKRDTLLSMLKNL